MNDRPEKGGSVLAYIFPAIIFIYGLIAVIRRRMWLHDPGGSSETVMGMQAVLLGISTMIFGYLVYVVIRYVDHGLADEFNPMTPTNKIALWVCLALATIGGLWEAIRIVLSI